MKNKAEIRGTVESFLVDWNRGDWMVEHGDWASAEWDDAREELDAAQAEMTETLTGSDRDDQKRAAAALVEAIDALDGEVCQDESDYIAEGTIDPDDVESGADELDVGDSFRAWNCTEGWRAHRSGDALVLNWYRINCCGGQHERDLWVVVDSEFFAEEEEEV